jgi:hypothetical protein
MSLVCEIWLSNKEWSTYLKNLFVVFLCTAFFFIIVIMFNRSIDYSLIVTFGAEVRYARQQVAKTDLTFASGRKNVGFTEKKKYVCLF